MISRERPLALLVDLDGVLRSFDPSLAADIECRYQLPDGALMRSAFTLSRILAVLVGAETHAAWLESVVADLAPVAGGHAQARTAIEEWQAHRGAVVTEALGVVREARAARIPVGLATNATDWLDADLAKLGLAGEFDAVINSSVIGAHKPTREFFDAACRAVGHAPACCLLVDDDRNVRGARVTGLSAYRWNGAADLPYLRAALGL